MVLIQTCGPFVWILFSLHLCGFSPGALSSLYIPKDKIIRLIENHELSAGHNVACFSMWATSPGCSPAFVPRQLGLAPAIMCRAKVRTNMFQISAHNDTSLSNLISLYQSLLTIVGHVIRVLTWRSLAVAQSLLLLSLRGKNGPCGCELQLQTSCFGIPSCVSVCVCACVRQCLCARVVCAALKLHGSALMGNLLRLPRMIHQENSASSIRHWRWVDKRTPLNTKSRIT